jgi:hypothetical protein
MKSKQLANVLIKIIGLYVCLTAIPGIISGIIVALELALGAKGGGGLILSESGYAIGEIIKAAAGLYLITQSHALAGYWFKTDEE